jgi:hypothetical protein
VFPKNGFCLDQGETTAPGTFRRDFPNRSPVTDSEESLPRFSPLETRSHLDRDGPINNGLTRRACPRGDLQVARRSPLLSNGHLQPRFIMLTNSYGPGKLSGQSIEETGLTWTTMKPSLVTDRGVLAAELIGESLAASECCNTESIIVRSWRRFSFNLMKTVGRAGF